MKLFQITIHLVTFQQKQILTIQPILLPQICKLCLLGCPKMYFFQKKILYERFPIPMAYIRHHAKFEASRTTSQGRSGITLFSIGICKNRIVQNDKMAITFLFDLQMKN